MNIQEYISSGILESYLLGALTDLEREAVEKNLAQYDALRQERARLEEISEALFLQAAVKPPAAVKRKVMQSLGPKGRMVNMNTASPWKYVAAASIAIALAASILAYDYHARWKRSEYLLNDLIAQNKQIAQDYNRVNHRLDKVENDLRIIDNPAFTKVIMKGTPNAPEAMASVYWNDQTREVFLSIQNLRELSQQNQYQLWAIIDGTPVDAGVFDGKLAGLVKMKAIAKGAATFAVTIEPRGGRPSPTLATMQVAGRVVKG